MRLSVPEAALELLGHPYAVGARLERREVNCSVFVDHVVRAVYPAAQLARADMMILDRARPWSALEALVAAGVGELVDAPASCAWHVAQGWRGLEVPDEADPGTEAQVVGRSRGHTWLWRASGDGAVGHILEATPLRVTWSRPAVWSTQIGGFDTVRLVRLT